jgi:hypothetical protein
MDRNIAMAKLHALAAGARLAGERLRTGLSAG